MNLINGGHTRQVSGSTHASTGSDLTHDVCVRSRELTTTHSRGNRSTLIINRNVRHLGLHTIQLIQSSGTVSGQTHRLNVKGLNRHLTLAQLRTRTKVHQLRTAAGLTYQVVSTKRHNVTGRGVLSRRLKLRAPLPVLNGNLRRRISDTVTISRLVSLQRTRRGNQRAHNTVNHRGTRILTNFTRRNTITRHRTLNDRRQRLITLTGQLGAKSLLSNLSVRLKGISNNNSLINIFGILNKGLQ